MVLKERKKYHTVIRNELQRQKAGLSGKVVIRGKPKKR